MRNCCWVIRVVAICALEATDVFLNASWSGSVIVAGSGIHTLWPSYLVLEYALLDNGLEKWRLAGLFRMANV